MLSYKFQIQQKSRIGYRPFFLRTSSTPMEFDDLQVASEKFDEVCSRFNKCTFRLVKIETYLIDSYEY